MKLFRLALAGLALSLAWAARNAPAQSIEQNLTFSIMMQYQYTTNTLIEGGAGTNYPLTIHTLLVSSHNVLKAIAVDLFGEQWTNWSGGSLLRCTNPTNGAEGIFLRAGPHLTNVSSFFGLSFSNNFTHNVMTAFPGLTNNFLPPLPLLRGWITNRPSGPATNLVSEGDVYFVSLNTTNLKFNLTGVNLVAVGNGRFANVAGALDGVQYSADVNSILVSAIGSLYINQATNLFDGTPFDPYSGTAHGTFATGLPVFTRFPGP